MALSQSPGASVLRLSELSFCTGSKSQAGYQQSLYQARTVPVRWFGGFTDFRGSSFRQDLSPGRVVCNCSKPVVPPNALAKSRHSLLRSRSSAARLSAIHGTVFQETGSRGTSTRATEVADASTTTEAPTGRVLSAAEEEELFYSDRQFDRAAERRSDTEWLSRTLENANTLVVPVWDRKSLVRDGKAVVLKYTKVLEEVQKEGWTPVPILLGVQEDQTAVFALDVTHQKAGSQDEVPPVLRGSEGADFVDLRREGPNLPPREAALLAYGRGLVDWHTRTRFCGKDGAPMIATEAGHAMKCSSCGSSVYPRLDPAVIMLVTCNDYVLLGRQQRWAKGRYSCLAGFAELGETMEMAVSREVSEEAGIDLDHSSIKYVASQPWPFPQSLMIGFTAEARPTALPQEIHSLVENDVSESENDISESENDVNESKDGVSESKNGASSERSSSGSSASTSASGFARLRPGDLGSLTGMQLPEARCDEKELEDARWFHKDWLRFSLSLQPGAPELYGTLFGLPGKYAIARRLIGDWLAQQSEEPWAGDAVQQVKIEEGTFKYVLLRLSDGTGRSRLLVRGNVHAPYHNDIFEKTQWEVQPLGLKLEALGGGRIEHSPATKLLYVYGFSYAFGQAKHELTASLLQRWFPLYDTITTSDEGY